MAFFDRLFGKGKHAAQARAAELRGDLAKAAELFGAAGQPEEAARVMILRSEGETDARAKLQYLAQAAQLAAQGSERNKEARQRRAELMLALAGDASVSAVARHEVIEAAKDLEAIGRCLEAAEAYARAGDKEGEARALQAAGDVERLEFLLSTEQYKERLSRAREDKTKDVDLMIECGRRREALAALDELLAATPDDLPLRERANALRARRVSAPIVSLEMLGERWTMVLGDEVVIGRTEGSIKVSSNAVSRQHLRITRDAGEVVVRDLESRNGTQLRGINLAGALPVREGLELKLGREVTLRVHPSTKLESAIEIEVAGQRYVAPLGPAKLPVPGLMLATGADGWVEVVANGAHLYVGDVEWTERATLLAGDGISVARKGEPALKVVST
ncbi:MAG: FHA domain-containing protein [Deltaproteobacteria bacterium]|nr:FHA domain-containing protein [Deltaproteobacteria bacterium]